MSSAPAVHLVVGDDARFRADATKALIAELLGADDPSLALEEFSLAPRSDAGDADSAPAADGPPIVAAALGSASTPPFGTERRVIVIREAGAMGASDAEAVANAVRFVKEADADAVKLEGGGASLSRVRSIVGAGIPVMGHIGLTPQSATMLGGYKAQGRTAAKARA